MLIIRQIDWREVGWPLSCNAFAIARFLVVFRSATANSNSSAVKVVQQTGETVCSGLDFLSAVVDLPPSTAKV